MLRWVGEGAKTTLATAPDADILRRILEVLRKRIEAGAVTFLIKIKAHRGEPRKQKHWRKSGEKRKRKPQSGQKGHRG